MIFQESKAALDMMKELAGYIKAKANHDPQLMELVSDVRTKLLELYEENAGLRGRCEEQERLLALRSGMRFDNDKHVYYACKNDECDGPFCQVCYDKEERLSRVRQEKYGHRCAVCGCFTYSRGGEDVEDSDRLMRARAQEYTEDYDPFHRLK